MSTEGVSPSLDSTIGIELIGFGVALAIYGIICAQTAAYFRRYGRLPFTPCMYMVTMLWLLETVHTVIISYAFAGLVVWGHADSLVFLRSPWTVGALVMISEMNCTLVRLGYAYRIWKYSGRRLLMPFLITIVSLVALAIGLDFAAHEVHIMYWSEGGSLEWTLYAAYACQLAVDGMISISMFLVLRGFTGTGHKRLDLIVRTLILYVVNTGLLATLCVILGTIFFALLPGTFVFVALYYPLSKLYTCSFLGVLNAEQLLIRHAAVSSGEGTSVPVLSSAVRIGPSALIWEEELSDILYLSEP